MADEGEGALPTLRCPKCGSADLHFRSSGLVLCSRCRGRWTPKDLRRSPGTPGHHSDRGR